MLYLVQTYQVFIAELKVVFIRISLTNSADIYHALSQA